MIRSATAPRPSLHEFPQLRHRSQDEDDDEGAISPDDEGYVDDITGKGCEPAFRVAMNLHGRLI